MGGKGEFGGWGVGFVEEWGVVLYVWGGIGIVEYGGKGVGGELGLVVVGGGYLDGVGDGGGGEKGKCVGE